jgi:hypothetical protein
MSFTPVNKPSGRAGSMTPMTVHNVRPATGLQRESTLIADKPIEVINHNPAAQSVQKICVAEPNPIRAG